MRQREIHGAAGEGFEKILVQPSWLPYAFPKRRSRAQPRLHHGRLNSQEPSRSCRKCAQPVSCRRHREGAEAREAEGPYVCDPAAAAFGFFSQKAQKGLAGANGRTVHETNQLGNSKDTTDCLFHAMRAKLSGAPASPEAIFRSNQCPGWVQVLPRMPRSSQFRSLLEPLSNRRMSQCDSFRP